MCRKVLNIKELVLSHVFLIAGLVLVTIGLLQEAMVLNIIGIWVFAIGLCLGFTFAFGKLVGK